MTAMIWMMVPFGWVCLELQPEVLKYGTEWIRRLAESRRGRRRD